MQIPPAETSIPGIVSARRTDRARLACAGIIAAGAIAAYFGTFKVPLLFDDLPTIAGNPTIRHLGSALFPPINTTASGRPLLNLSLALNYAISGNAVWSYHAANLLIHVLAGLTLFGIVRRTLEPRSDCASSIAFSTALLWTLHPLQTESVTYIVQRAESLMGLFYLLTLYCFIRYAECEHPFARRIPLPSSEGGEGKTASLRFWAVLSVLACLFGMATKEVMVSAPLIVLLYDRTFLAGNFRGAFRRRWRVYAGLGATWPVLFFLVRSTHGRGGTVGFGSGISWWSYALTQFPAIVRYLRLSVWPHPLIFDYGMAWIGNLRTILPSAVVVVGLMSTVAWALFRPGPGWRSLGFAGAWFFAILAPTSLIPGNRQTAVEHRMYVALVPVVALAAVGMHRRLGRAALPASLALAAGLFAVTVQRNGDYRTALSLWSDTVAKNPVNPGPHNNLGNVLVSLNSPAALPRAVAELETALRLKPDFADADFNLGNALNAEGRTREAVARYEEALRLRPDFAEAHNNLGYALERVPGRLDEAIDHYGIALRLKPDDAEAHINLGNALDTEGRTLEAVSHYEEALRLEPDDAAAHFNLAVALLRIPGRAGEARAHLETVLLREPANERARQILDRIRKSQPQ